MRSDDECNYLMETFSGMKINNQAGALKRSADLMTVEGSPVNLTKRIDMNQTPNTKFLQCPFSRRVLQEEESTLDQSSVVVLRNDATVKTLSPKGCTLHPRKVLVISSVSDDHDTGNHQENALRTALLCGSNGCLRRGQLGTDPYILRTD